MNLRTTFYDQILKGIVELLFGKPIFESVLFREKNKYLFYVSCCIDHAGRLIARYELQTKLLSNFRFFEFCSYFNISCTVYPMKLNCFVSELTVPNSFCY